MGFQASPETFLTSALGLAGFREVIPKNPTNLCTPEGSAGIFVCTESGEHPEQGHEPVHDFSMEFSLTFPWNLQHTWTLSWATHTNMTQHPGDPARQGELSPASSCTSPTLFFPANWMRIQLKSWLMTLQMKGCVIQVYLEKPNPTAARVIACFRPQINLI